METYINKSPYKLGQFGEQLATMTEQEVFNIAAEHLILQNKKSLLGDDCVYDGGDVCCAAAPFIKDYRPDMEYNDWVMTVVNPEKLHENLIGKLQTMHDLSVVDNWFKELLSLAEDFNLELPEILKGEY